MANSVNKIKTVKWDAKFDPQFQNTANDIQKQFKADLQAARSDNPQISRPIYQKYGIMPNQQYATLDSKYNIGARGGKQINVGRQALIKRIGQRARNNIQPYMEAAQQKNKWHKMQNATTDRARAQIAKDYYDPTKHFASQVARTGIGNLQQNIWNGWWQMANLPGSLITGAMDLGQQFINQSIKDPSLRTHNTASNWYKNFRDNVVAPKVNSMLDWRSQQERVRDAQLGIQRHKLTLTGKDRLQGATNDNKINLFGKELPVTQDAVASTGFSLLAGGLLGSGTRAANVAMLKAKNFLTRPTIYAKHIANIAKTQGTKQAAKQAAIMVAKPAAQYATYSLADTTLDYGINKTQQQIANSNMDPQAKAFWLNLTQSTRKPVQYLAARFNPIAKAMPKNKAVPGLFRAFRGFQAFQQPIKNTFMPKFSPFGGVSQAQTRKASTGSIVPEGVSPAQYMRTAVNNQAVKYDPQYRPFYKMFSTAPQNAAWLLGTVPGYAYSYLNKPDFNNINTLTQEDIRSANAQERLSRIQSGVPTDPYQAATAKEIYNNAMKNARTAPVTDAMIAAGKYGLGLPVSDAQMNSMLVAASQPVDAADISKGYKNPRLHNLVAAGTSKQITNYFNQMKSIAAQKDPVKRQKLLKALKQKQLNPLHMQMALGNLGQPGIQKVINSNINTMSSGQLRTMLQTLATETDDKSPAAARIKTTISKYGAPAVGKRMTALMQQAKTDQDIMKLCKDAIVMSKYAPQGPAEQQPQWKKEMTSVFSGKVKKAVWNNPLQNLPAAIGLWLSSKGFSGMGEFISSPLAFWGSLGVLVIGGGLLLGSAFGGKEQQQPQQQAQQQQAPFNLYSSSFMR